MDLWYEDRDTRLAVLNVERHSEADAPRGFPTCAYATSRIYNSPNCGNCWLHLRSNFRRISFRIPNFHRNFNLSFVLPYKANFQIEIHSPSIDFNLFFFPNNLRGKKKTHTSISINYQLRRKEEKKSAPNKKILSRKEAFSKS